MIRKAPHATAASEHGFVLVAVLWIVAALSALAIIFSAYLSNTAQALSVSDIGLQAEALVSGSVELTAYQLSLAGEKARPMQGSFHYRLDNADITVSFVSETGRIDLNAASKDLLANLFASLGAGPEDAAQYADRIIGWRTPPKANATDDEVSLYRAAGLAYSPRQAPFAHVDELALVQGLPPALVDRALPLVTVYSGQPKINVLVAAPEVIAALPGMTPSGLKQFLRERPVLPNDMAAIATALGPAQANAAIDKSDFFRILTTVRFGNGRQTASEVVIGLAGEEDPYRVLSWQDEVEARTSHPTRPAEDGDDL
ncbi:general secretion pathway protein K [Bradyrhizobium lablabi]|uniref:General secretion pathway protein K n=1 Tax=Bradyrhizobium lablabi TaxID=722472 RepID=A0A1M6KCQ9_9BRAD|nr:type II secretion system protein GspK [Bradyrhizobium lablabi]SHJ56712.1 general secretion pathway protein K [Bradyrhizobium lablabi]